MMETMSHHSPAAFTPQNILSKKTKMNLDLVKREIMQIDEDLSRPIFEMSLPPTAEYILSVPGNVFGMVPSLMVGPLWTMIVLNNDDETGSSSSSSSPPWTLIIVTCLLSLCYLGAWVEFNRGNFAILKRYLMAGKMYMVAPILTTAFCYTQTSDQRLLSLALYTSVLWTLSLAITLAVKNIALRDRPVSKFPNLIDRKNLTAIPNLLNTKYQAKASFPSGDATGVVCFALPLGTQYPTVAGLLVLTCCFGRIYFLAHHFLDTFAGCTTTYCIHLLLTQLGAGLENTYVWHPILALVILVASVKGGKHRV